MFFIKNFTKKHIWFILKENHPKESRSELQKTHKKRHNLLYKQPF